MDLILEHEMLLTALRRTLEWGGPEIPHSDQRVRYPAMASVELRKSRAMEMSMASAGVLKQNEHDKIFIKMIKEEEMDRSESEDRPDVRRRLPRLWDDVYNTKRIHSSLGSLIASEFEQQWVDSQCVR